MSGCCRELRAGCPRRDPITLHEHHLMPVPSQGTPGHLPFLQGHLRTCSLRLWPTRSSVAWVCGCGTGMLSAGLSPSWKWWGCPCSGIILSVCAAFSVLGYFSLSSTLGNGLPACQGDPSQGPQVKKCLLRQWEGGDHRLWPLQHLGSSPSGQVGHGMAETPRFLPMC